MVEHQGPRRRAVCKIIVGGGSAMQDVTDKIRPYLISVQVIDSINGNLSECHLELDDRNAELQIPPDNVTLQVALGWAGDGPHLFDSGRQSAAGGQGEIKENPLESIQRPYGGPGMELVFDGFVINSESGFGRRGGGRRLWVEGSGADIKGQLKQTQHTSQGQGNQDDAAASQPTSDSGGGGGGAPGGGGAAPAGGSSGEIPLKKVLTDLFGKVGMQVKLSPAMTNIARNFWHINESPMNFIQRIAGEVGGIAKIEHGIATIVGRNEGVNADGVAMPTVDAVWGINLIGWRIKPYAARPQYGKAKSSFFDLFQAAHLSVEKAISGITPFGGTDAIAHGIATVMDKNQGEQANTGSEEESSNRRGTGWVLLNGEPTARGGGKVRIKGARPGVDGLYQINEAEHNYSRHVGYTTRCTVSYPVPDLGGYGWMRESEQQPPPAPTVTGPPQSTDPMKPNYISPSLDRQLQGLTEAEKQALLQEQDRTWGGLEIATDKPTGVGHN